MELVRSYYNSMLLIIKSETVIETSGININFKSLHLHIYIYIIFLCRIFSKLYSLQMCWKHQLNTGKIFLEIKKESVGRKLDKDIMESSSTKLHSAFWLKPVKNIIWILDLHTAEAN